MTADLDTMLHTASDSLHQAVDGLPAADAPRPSPVPRLVAAAVLVAALVAGGALVLRHRGHEGSISDIPAGADDIPRLVADGHAHGLRATGAVDLPLPAKAQTFGTISVYGAGDDADPFAEDDLMVFVLGPGASGPTQGESVTVRGRPATLATGAEPAATSLTWKESDEVTITLGSRTLGRDRLIAVAQGLRVDGRRVTLGALPPGVDGRLRRIGRDMALSAGVPPALPVSAPGHVVGYDSGRRVAAVVTYAGDAGDLAVARFMSSADRPIEVRGHRGWAGVAAVGGSVELRTIVWEESPGVIAVVAGTDGEATLLALADGLSAPSDAEWRALLDRAGSDDSGTSSGSASISAPMATVPGEGAEAHQAYASGTYPGGTWGLYDEAGQLCLSSESGDSGSSVCGDPRARVTTLHDNGGAAVMVFGVLPAGAAGAEVPGAVAPVEVHGLPDGRRVYVAAIDPDHVPDHVTLVDAAGGTVDTLAVDG
jgi:hypothetical protein